MTLDNMTGITEGSYTGFCKSQLITCNRVKECNGVCPFEDALKHADKMQTINEQHTVDHDRDWIIGCIEHDGFIHTHRFDKANQIIHDALSAEAVQGWIPIKYHEITEIERKENGYPKDWVYSLDCEMPQDGQEILVQAKNGEIRWDVCYEDDGFSLDSGWDWKDDIIAWMPLPDPYKGGDDK